MDDPFRERRAAGNFVSTIGASSHTTDHKHFTHENFDNTSNYKEERTNLYDKSHLGQKASEGKNPDPSDRTLIYSGKPKGNSMQINNFNFFMKNTNNSAKRDDLLNNAPTGNYRSGRKQSIEREENLAKYHSNLFGDDVRLLNALKIKMALSCKGCPTAKEPFIMLEEELAKTLRPNPVNLDKAYSQYDQTSFDQWQKVASIQQEMEIKLQTKLSRRLHL